MKISRDNYEAYLMDYLEGTLSLALIPEMLQFLEMNPDIRLEAEGIMNPVNEGAAEVMPGKEFLHKPVYHQIKEEYQNLIIERLEGEIELRDSAKLNRALMVYPELKQDDFLFRLTKLQPEKRVVFPHHRALKKETPVISLVTFYRVAAVLTLFGFGYWIFLLPVLNNNNSEIAEIRKTIDNPSTIQKREPSAVSLPKYSTHLGFHTHFIAYKSTELIPKQVVSPGIIERKEQPEVIAFTGLSTIPNQQISERLMANPASPEQINPSEEFPNLKKFAINKLESGSKKIFGTNDEGKPLSFLQAINKVTGSDISVEKNEEGKIRRFEIASLGIGWSQSK